MKGIIAVSGPDGAGKTTLVKNLVAYYQDEGESVLHIKEPNISGRCGDLILASLQGREDFMDDELALFYTLNRMERNLEIAQYLDAGGLIIQDRCLLDTLAYQGHSREDWRWIWNVSRSVFKPDQYIVINTNDPAELLARIGNRNLKKSIYEADIDELGSICRRFTDVVSFMNDIGEVNINTITADLSPQDMVDEAVGIISDHYHLNS